MYYSNEEEGGLILTRVALHTTKSYTLLLTRKSWKKKWSNSSVVTHDEMVTKHGNDQFYKMIRGRVENGESLLYQVTHDGILLRLSPKIKQIVVPVYLVPKILKLIHHTSMGAHLGGRKLYRILRQHYNRPSMSFNCFGIPRYCLAFAKERSSKKKRLIPMMKFPALASLEDIAMDVMGDFVKKPRTNRYLFAGDC